MPPLHTPSQTIGPFYWGTIVNSYHCDLAPPAVAGERIDVVLQLHDVEGAIVADGLFEIWQANSHGRYNHPDDRRNLPWRASPRCGPAACRGPMATGWAACRRRTSTSPSSPAASSIGWRRGSTSTATRRLPRIRC